MLQEKLTSLKLITGRYILDVFPLCCGDVNSSCFTFLVQLIILSVIPEQCSCIVYDSLYFVASCSLVSE